MTEIIRIGAFDYAIEIVERLRDIEGVRSLAGDIQYSHPKIRIDQDQDEQNKYRILWHEIVHGIADTMGVDLEENEVELLATGMAQLHRDNRWVLEKYYPQEWL